ncbi:MAG: hypothetical protein GY719_25650 [bacterium]|nr:hypothetical protein [bacterium]
MASSRELTGYRVASLGLALLCLLWTACFDLDQPVDEHLLISFWGEHPRMHLSVELRHPENADDSSALARRLLRLEEELLGGLDPWPDRFGRPRAPTESFSWTKEEGRLVRLRRDLILDDPRDIPAVLSDTAIQTTYTEEDGVAELSFFPSLAGRATRRERREMEQVLGTWSAALEDYYQAAEALYRYLDTRPDRAVPCFAEIFDQDDDKQGEILPEEEELIEAYGEAAGEVLDVLDTDQKREYTLDELSRRVYDPFPARFEVELRKDPIEVEGFVRSAHGWVVPGLSLWATFEHLEGKWLVPDPLVAWVTSLRASPSGKTDVDVELFASDPRRAFAPDSLEIRDAIEAGLTPEDVYRITWPVAKSDTAAP